MPRQVQQILQSGASVVRANGLSDHVWRNVQGSTSDASMGDEDAGRDGCALQALGGGMRRGKGHDEGRAHRPHSRRRRRQGSCAVLHNCCLLVAERAAPGSASVRGELSGETSCHRPHRAQSTSCGRLGGLAPHLAGRPKSRDDAFQANAASVRRNEDCGCSRRSPCDCVGASCVGPAKFSPRHDRVDRGQRGEGQACCAPAQSPQHAETAG